MTAVFLWLDDERPAPAGWIHVKTAREAMIVASSLVVEEASLDHDLGPHSAGTGMEFLEWMVKTARWPLVRVTVHSANEPRKNEMKALLRERWPIRRDHARCIINHLYMAMPVGTHQLCPDPACCTCWCPGCVYEWRAANRPGPQNCIDR